MEDSTVFQYNLSPVKTGSRQALRGEMLVGREVECQIHLDSPQISRYHAKLYFRAGKLFVRDLNSSNGTYINGVSIKGEAPLHFGDELSFHTEKFRITSRNSGESDATVIQPKHIPELQQIVNKADSPKPKTPAKPVNPAQASNSDIHNRHVEPFDERNTQFIAPDQRMFLSSLPDHFGEDLHSGPRLISLTAPIRGKCFELSSKDEFASWSIGRNEHAEIEIKHETVSRIHAWVTKMGDIYEVKDSKAKNGLLINGVIHTDAILRHGDVIQVGTTSFLYRSDVKQQDKVRKNPFSLTIDWLKSWFI